jgi:protein O-GlcNAc transferase
MAMTPNDVTVAQAVQMGMAHQQAGRLDDAERIYRQVLSREPNHAKVVRLMGILEHQRGRLDSAVEMLRKAIEIEPRFAEAYSDLGNALLQIGKLKEAAEASAKAVEFKPGLFQPYMNLGYALGRLGRFEEAVGAFRKAVGARPAFVEGYYSLGSALRDAGRAEEAMVAFQQATQVQPLYADAHCALGNLFMAGGSLEKAVAAYERAIAANGQFGEALANLAKALHLQGKHRLAEQACERAVSLRPDLAETHDNLGSIQRHLGKLEDSVAAHRRAIEIRPEFAAAHSNLGNALLKLGKRDEALAEYKRALELQPNFAVAHSNLGNALQTMRRFDESVAAYRRAMEIDPGFADAHCNFGNALVAVGQVEQALDEYHRAVALSPGNAAIASNRLLPMHYTGTVTARQIWDAHRAWGEKFAAPIGPVSGWKHLNDRAPGRRLRVGYVSPDFREHAVSYFMLPLLAAHDREVVEVFAYAHLSMPDQMTRRLASHVEQWRNTVGQSDAEIAATIRQDEIDILVDLAGHTADYRLQMFALKPAPVQVTWLGYPDTTGVNAIDYRLTDAYADPPELDEGFHSEELVRLSPTAWCYEPPDRSIQTAPRSGGAPIVFGCCNNFAKVSERMLRVWADLLERVEGSRLLLKSSGVMAASAQQRVRGLFRDAGVASERIEFRGWSPENAEHLASYADIDIALDTFPYHGTTTTCESLWMGRPVVTLAGKIHASRVGVSLLSNVGLPELIAGTAEEYVQVAVALAKDRARLRQLQSGLRKQMEASPLMDAAGFAREMERVYGEIWETRRRSELVRRSEKQGL